MALAQQCNIPILELASTVQQLLGTTVPSGPVASGDPTPSVPNVCVYLVSLLYLSLVSHTKLWCNRMSSKE